MSAYVYFTDEQKRQANNVDLVDFLEKRGETLIRSGPEKRLASDRSVTVRGNEWFDHSSGRGGYPISFVQQFYGLTYPEAVTMLLGGEQGEVYESAEAKKQEPKKAFALPDASADMRRVYAYLLKSRLLDREVVGAFAREKLIYESCEKSRDGLKEYHNAVFVGLDENGIPRHAHKRGIYTQGKSFKGNVDGCDPAYSFHWAGRAAPAGNPRTQQDAKSEAVSLRASGKLYVFEAPIDLLSYITLHPQDWRRHSYVALCGVGGQAMLKLLELHPEIGEVVLCTDHDPAGIEAAERFADLLAEQGVSSSRELSAWKDWNEDIKAAHGMEAIPAEEHPQHQLRDELCAELALAAPDVKANCSADALAGMLTRIRDRLHWGKFGQAEDCLRELLCCAASASVRERRQMGQDETLSGVADALRLGFKAYENRGRLQTRLDLLESEIMALRGFEGVLTASEKEKLAENYERIAAHCLKAAVGVEQQIQKQEPEQEQEQRQAPEMRMA